VSAQRASVPLVGDASMREFGNWRSIEDAPLEEEVDVFVTDAYGSCYRLRDPCRRTLRGWVSAATGMRLAVTPVMWKPLIRVAASQGKDPLVFAAASLKNALDDIAAHWDRQTGKKVEISYAASNSLIKQIEQGAPADIFFSADLDWMD
jgi:hypothetical protein